MVVVHIIICLQLNQLDSDSQLTIMYPTVPAGLMPAGGCMLWVNFHLNPPSFYSHCNITGIAIIVTRLSAWSKFALLIMHNIVQGERVHFTSHSHLKKDFSHEPFPKLTTLRTLFH